MSATQTLSTATEQVVVRTPRGNLTIGPRGAFGGLWRLTERELRSNREVRAMCRGLKQRGGVPRTKAIPDRKTLQWWRQRNGFPDPVVNLDGVDYWSRTAVEAWIRARPTD